MVDDLHRLVRMRTHDDLRWRFGEGGAIELRPDPPGGPAARQLDALCRTLGFEERGGGAWRVPTDSPHYEDLWVFVEQERIDRDGG